MFSHLCLYGWWRRDRRDFSFCTREKRWSLFYVVWVAIQIQFLLLSLSHVNAHSHGTLLSSSVFMKFKRDTFYPSQTQIMNQSLEVCNQAWWNYNPFPQIGLELMSYNEKRDSRSQTEQVFRGQCLYGIVHRRRWRWSGVKRHVYVSDDSSYKPLYST